MSAGTFSSKTNDSIFYIEGYFSVENCMRLVLQWSKEEMSLYFGQMMCCTSVINVDHCNEVK